MRFALYYITLYWIIKEKNILFISCLVGLGCFLGRYYLDVGVILVYIVEVFFADWKWRVFL